VAALATAAVNRLAAGAAGQRQAPQQQPAGAAQQPLPHRQQPAGAAGQQPPPPQQLAGAAQQPLPQRQQPAGAAGQQPPPQRQLAGAAQQPPQPARARVAAAPAAPWPPVRWGLRAGWNLGLYFPADPLYGKRRLLAACQLPDFRWEVRADGRYDDGTSASERQRAVIQVFDSGGAPAIRTSLRLVCEHRRDGLPVMLGSLSLTGFDVPQLLVCDSAFAQMQAHPDYAHADPREQRVHSVVMICIWFPQAGLLPHSSAARQHVETTRQLFGSAEVLRQHRPHPAYGLLLRRATAAVAGVTGLAGEVAGTMCGKALLPELWERVGGPSAPFGTRPPVCFLELLHSGYAGHSDAGAIGSVFDEESEQARRQRGERGEGVPPKRRRMAEDVMRKHVGDLTAGAVTLSADLQSAGGRCMGSLQEINVLMQGYVAETSAAIARFAAVEAAAEAGMATGAQLYADAE
jgi:hypothetical protein